MHYKHTTYYLSDKNTDEVKLIIKNNDMKQASIIDRALTALLDECFIAPKSSSCSKNRYHAKISTGNLKKIERVKKKTGRTASYIVNEVINEYVRQIYSKKGVLVQGGNNNEKI